MTRSPAGAGVLMVFFAGRAFPAGRGFAAVLRRAWRRLSLLPAVFVPAALVRLVCFAAFLPLDFLLLGCHLFSSKCVRTLIVTAGTVHCPIRRGCRAGVRVRIRRREDRVPVVGCRPSDRRARRVTRWRRFRSADRAAARVFPAANRLAALLNGTRSQPSPCSGTSPAWTPAGSRVSSASSVKPGRAATIHWASMRASAARCQWCRVCSESAPTRQKSSSAGGQASRAGAGACRRCSCSGHPCGARRWRWRQAADGRRRQAAPSPSGLHRAIASDPASRAAARPGP